MARATICDHCGKVVPNIQAEHVVFYPLHTNGSYSVNSPDKSADLCPACYSKFKQMLGLEVSVDAD
jgi:hypothetical protein